MCFMCVINSVLFLLVKSLWLKTWHRWYDQLRYVAWIILTSSSRVILPTPDQWRRQLWGTGARAPRLPTSYFLITVLVTSAEAKCTFSKLELINNKLSNMRTRTTRKIVNVQSEARSGASGWYWQDCAQISALGENRCIVLNLLYTHCFCVFLLILGYHS